MRPWTGRALALAALLLATPAPAAVLDYTSFHVLGDSLSDNGNAFRASLGRVPESPPYYRGRFSNGRVWAERVADRFKAAGLPTGNHAFGGAKARGNSTAESLGLVAQAARYRALDRDRRGNRPLLGVWIGSNDILFADDDRNIRQVGRRAAGRVGDVAVGLALSGVDDFLLFNLPDLGKLPTYGDDPAGARRASAGVRAFNRELGRQIAALRGVGVQVRKVDSFALLDDIVAHPRRYGLSNVTTPCLDADDNPCTPRQGRNRAFFDELHPNKLVHRAIAETALGRIAGGAARSAAAAAAPAAVPLPGTAALLAGGLLALGLAARRRPFRMRGGAAALAALLLAAPAQAAVLDYTSFHVLGDSLSDKGNVYSATFGRTPESPPYWNGRFSNGRVWAEHVADDFEAARLPTGNHAWGGANARSDSDGIPDIALQARSYRLVDRDERGARPLLAIWAGANDILDSAGAPGIREVGRRAADAFGDTAASLARSGVSDFLVLNLPDLGRIPRFGDDPADARSATAGTRAFNRQLNRQIAALRDDGARVQKVNVHALFDALMEDPRSFGLRDTTTPCLDENDNPCTRRQGRARAFFDRIHPNRVVHRRVAEAVLAELAGPAAATAAAPAPVPLPAPGALLAAGLLVLGLTARRRR